MSRVALFAPLVLLALPELEARAQQVYYAPPPPPPPPPPGVVYAPAPAYGYGYGYARPVRREYYVEEPANRFDLGFDVEGAIPVNAPTLPDGNRIQGGSGFKLRFGDQIRISPDFRLTPEVGFAYDHLWASDDYGNAYDWDTNRVFGGFRFTFGRFVMPSFYGHLGLGWRSTDDPSVASTSGLAADLGGALDFRIGRHFQLGGHVEYDVIDAAPYTPKWVAIGLHGDIVF